jgi:hypothetical protein
LDAFECIFANKQQQSKFTATSTRISLSKSSNRSSARR